MKKMFFFSVEEVCVELGYSVNQQILEKNMKKKLYIREYLVSAPSQEELGEG